MREARWYKTGRQQALVHEGGCKSSNGAYIKSNGEAPGSLARSAVACDLSIVPPCIRYSLGAGLCFIIEGHAHQGQFFSE